MDYKQKLEYQSNYWYNDGLKKAQIRDLSGAIVSLKRSLQFNRENITARNLLGLVYYGRGEVAEALVEWIISKNFRASENIASYYISKVQDNPSELEKVNQAVHKYNQCLGYQTEWRRSCDHPAEKGGCGTSVFPEGISASGTSLYAFRTVFQSKTEPEDGTQAGCDE